MQGLPTNGQKIITNCPNCDAEFEEPQELGKPAYCDESYGGCGWRFVLRTHNSILKQGEPDKD